MADIKLTFRGEDYIIPDSKAFQAGAVVEEIAGLYEVLRWVNEPPLNKLARCFGALLRFAGAKVSDRDVHRDLVDVMGQGPLQAMVAMQALIAVLMDGAPLEAPMQDAALADGSDAGKSMAS